MIAPSLHADLMSRGVIVGIAETPAENQSPELPPLRLHVKAPAGSLDESMRAALTEYRGELLQFVFELQERASILEVEQGNERERAEELARECVTGGMASPDGGLWLRAYAMNHPTVRAYFEAFGSFAGEIEVRRATNEDRQ